MASRIPFWRFKLADSTSPTWLVRWPERVQLSKRIYRITQRNSYNRQINIEKKLLLRSDRRWCYTTTEHRERINHPLWWANGSDHLWLFDEKEKPTTTSSQWITLILEGSNTSPNLFTEIGFRLCRCSSRPSTPENTLPGFPRLSSYPWSTIAFLNVWGRGMLYSHSFSL